MYNSQYYTCEQIDERLLQGYLDDYNTQTGQSLTKAQFLTKLGSLFSKEGVIDNTATQIGYYECDTAAGTAAKAITVANYALFAGGSMKVKFANKNTANNATLNINSQGAKALYYQGERASATNSWDANEVVEIYYDGTSYYANNVKGGSGSGVYDVSKEHHTSGPNSDGKFTLEYILNPSNVNELIPVNKRYPGMSIQFVSTSDNKYVQYRCMPQSFGTNPEDWAIEGYDVYVDNQEYVKVYLDANDRILWAIKADGSIFYGAGVPPQIVAFIQKKIDELSLDEYEDIVTFLGNLIEGDTLATLLNNKVDKVTGKSLIDADYASSQSAIEEPEYLDVRTDSENKILEAIKANGTKVIFTNLELRNPENIGVFESVRTNILSLSLQGIKNIKEDLKEIPDYWLNAIKTCITSVQANNVLSGYHGDSFVFVTDSHFPDNNGNGVKIAAEVSRHTNNKLFIHGGDFVTQNQSKADFFDILRNYSSQLSEYYGTNWRVLFGNHDINYQNSGGDPSQATHWDDFYALMYKGFENEVVNPNRNLHYYWDNVNQNIRYICLNYRSAGINEAQITWFIDKVQQAPENSNIVVISHGMWDRYNDNEFSGYNADLADICDAINTNGAYTFGGTSYDFSSQTQKVSCILCGHTHGDKQVYYGTSQIPVISFMADTQPSSAGTTGEQAVTFIDIDLTRGKIYIERLGKLAGSSERSVTYNIVL